MNALSTRPRNLCFAISVTGLIMFVIGCLVAKNGNCSVMGIGSAASLMVVLFGLVGAGRCAFARRQKMEEDEAAQTAEAPADTPAEEGKVLNLPDVPKRNDHQ